MAMIPVHRRMEASTTVSPQAERVLEVALDMAEQRGWQAVSLVEVAARLDIPASEVLDHYCDLDAVANAWFLHGWRAMLAEKPANFVAWSARERLEHCLLAWLDALAGHRVVTVQMLRTKAHPPHPHTWVPMIFDLSRTVQWWREAARLDAPYGTHRARLEEIGLCAIRRHTTSLGKRRQPWPDPYP